MAGLGLGLELELGLGLGPGFRVMVSDSCQSATSAPQFLFIEYVNCLWYISGDQPVKLYVPFLPTTSSPIFLLLPPT